MPCARRPAGDGRRDEQRHVNEREAGQEADKEGFRTWGRLEYQLPDAELESLLSMILSDHNITHK